VAVAVAVLMAGWLAWLAGWLPLPVPATSGPLESGSCTDRAIRACFAFGATDRLNIPMIAMHLHFHRHACPLAFRCAEVGEREED